MKERPAPRSAAHDPDEDDRGLARRELLAAGALAGIGVILGGAAGGCAAAGQEVTRGEAPIARGEGPVVISTWSHGMKANNTAFKILMGGASALDAVELGAMQSEKDPEVTSVGYGGLPNRDGVVELDAAIMNGADLEAGAVAGLHGILHPVAVARRVMEKTRHVLLVGDGARRFALEQGFEEQDLLTPRAREAWQKWRAGDQRRVPGQIDDDGKDAPKAPADDHDTIGMVAMDKGGNLAAACTTSGLAWKIPGRVGDSPLVGHGLYCDGKVGGAAATGIGEEVIKVCGSYQVVEFMRQGLDPDEAIRRVLRRIIDRDPKNARRMVGFVALRADGKVGFVATTPGFQAAVSRAGRHELLDAPSLVT